MKNYFSLKIDHVSVWAETLNKILSAVIIVLLAVNVVVMAVGFSYLQNEINLKANKSTTPETVNGANQRPLPYSSVVYEWFLKPSYIDNVTWLSGVIAYNPYVSWKQNYVSFLESQLAYPSQVSGSPLAAYYLSISVAVSQVFNETTGWTVATYRYAEFQNVTMSYQIEGYLPTIADNCNWTKTYT